MRTVSVSDLLDSRTQADEATVLGRDPVLVDLDREPHPAWPDALDMTGRITVGRSTRPLTAASAELAAHLTLSIAPHGPGKAWINADDDALAAIERAVRSAPVASSVLDRLLRRTQNLPPAAGAELESATYSMLLSAPEFRRWRSSTARSRAPADSQPAVCLSRDDTTLRIRLDRAARRNAFSRQMRDELLEALEVGALDPSVRLIELRGTGPAFCSGGDLDEFGTAQSTAEAHLVRMRQHAGLAIHRLRERVRPFLHGACVGAGIELPAFASRITAAQDTWFQLPELSMGLIPGAGGTVSITRRIGRWRTAFMALSGRRIDAATAVDWGLVDEVV